jgi:integrase
MPRKANNTVAANDLAIAKIIRTDVTTQCEWKVVGVPGLSLVKKPTGAADYYVRFMAGKGARRKSVRQAIGPARDRVDGRKAIKLSEAKTRALELVTGGSAHFDSDGGPRTTLHRLFEQFEENDKDRAARTMGDYREALERDVFETLGDVPVGEITAKDIAKALTKIESRSRNAAHKCRAALGSLYKWATKRLLVDANVMLGMGFTHKNKPRDRVLTTDELAALWHSIESEAFGASPATRIILKLAILTGQRNSEVAGARATELHIDEKVANPYWHIPKARMKRKTRDQYVFLSRQACELFQQARQLAGESEFVFPATTHGRHVEGEMRQHITQESVSHAMARVCKIAKLKDVHLHDLRKSISSWLGDRGERSDVLDRILHHHSGHSSGQRSSVTETHYNFSIMSGPLREAWQRWADHVESVARGIGAGETEKKVVQLHA